jgi:8-oxo-dGTP diphosphatase
MPGVAVGIVVMTLREDALQTLCIAGAGGWQLPYGRIGRNEPLRRGAERICRSQTGFVVDYLEQLYTFGNIVPEQGERLIEVCYYGLVPAPAGDGVAPGGRRAAIRWLREHELSQLPDLQARIAQRAHQRLRGKVAYTAVGFELLPEEFTLAELQHLYSTLLGKRIDKRNFRRKIAELGIVSATGAERLQTRGRPAALYSFRPEVFQRLESKGDILGF